MSTQFLPQKPLLALSLLAMAYTILGWYLAAHHVFLVVSLAVVVITLLLVHERHPFLESLGWLIQQQIFVVVGVSLLCSIFIAITFVKPVLLSLIPLPLLTLLYTLLEMRSAGFRQSSVFFWVVMITGFGLVLGEALDLFVVPSMRY